MKKKKTNWFWVTRSRGAATVEIWEGEEKPIQTPLGNWTREDQSYAWESTVTVCGRIIRKLLKEKTEIPDNKAIKLAFTARIIK